jgi:hypothetical protein
MSKAADLANLIGNINAGGGGVNRNCIINGAMNVAQRGTSTTGLKNTGAIYTIDRFSYRRAGTWTNFDSKHEQVDVTDALPSSKGFYKGLRVTCTTAEGSVPSGTECTGIGYYIEKQDLHKFCVGSSSMKTTVISFYVKASIATTYGFTIQGAAHSTTQQIDIPFTVSSANTYEKISITIPTYNVAFDSTADNDTGWRLFWGLDGVASSRTASTWGGSSDGFIMPNGVSATGFSNTLNATFEITGVQLEVGQNPTEFEHEPFDRTLEKCKRYYQIMCSDGVDFHAWVMTNLTTTATGSSMHLMTEMRSAPTLTINGTAQNSSGGSVGTDKWAVYHAGAWRGCSSISTENPSTTTFRLNTATNDAMTSGGSCGLYGGTACFIEAKAEL